MTPAPSGRQYDLRHGDQRVVVTEVGAGIRSYELGGRPILDGFPVGEMCSGGRGQHLLPWPNRIGDGRYEFGGRTHQLALSEAARRNAIHGLVRWIAWSAEPADAERLRMTTRLHPQPGYPFLLDLAIDYRLDDAGLTVATTAANIGSSACPYGAGAHPYLVAADRADDLSVTLPAATVLETDERGLPVGRRPVEGTSYDFRTSRGLGDQVVDHAFTDLERAPDGTVTVDVSGPHGAVQLWADERYRWLQVFTGDTLEGAARRRAIAVEPMTCPPHAFATGEDVIVLAPGESVTTTWGVRPT